MYAFETVLKHLHTALRPNGLVIIRIPEPKDEPIQAWRGDELVFSDYWREPIFNDHAATAKSIIRQTVASGQFRNDYEGLFDFTYHYDSVQTWIDNNETTTEDPKEFAELATKLREIDKENPPLRLTATYSEWTIFLKKP